MSNEKPKKAKSKKPSASTPGVVKKKQPSKAQKLKAVNAKLDKDVAKQIEDAVFAKACPQGHPQGADANAKFELVAEAGKQLLVDETWDVVGVKDSKGQVTHIVIEK